MPTALACGVLGNGLSPISSSTTSLPSAFRFRASPSTVNAVSTARFSASVLNRTMAERSGTRDQEGRGEESRSAGRCRYTAPSRCGLARGDRSRQGPDDPRDHQRFDDLLPDRALAAERIDVALLGA